MRNSPTLPVVAIVLALILSAIVAFTSAGREGPLSELELGAIAGAIGLAIYGVQGLISVLIEGRELRPGRVLPRLTDLLSVLIVLFSLLLFAISVFLAIGLTSGWRTPLIGGLAGAGCLVLALILIFYKEAFLGDEAALESRDDGIPW